jgi:hypothetical protein
MTNKFLCNVTCAHPDWHWLVILFCWQWLLFLMRSWGKSSRWRFTKSLRFYSSQSSSCDPTNNTSATTILMNNYFLNLNTPVVDEYCSFRSHHPDMPFNNMVPAYCMESVNTTAITPDRTWGRENNLKHIKTVHFSQKTWSFWPWLFFMHVYLMTQYFILVQSNDRMTSE